MQFFLLLFLSSFMLFPCDLKTIFRVTGFLGSSAGKESACNAGGPSSIPGLGRSPGEGTGSPLQYSWASLVAQLVKNPPAMWETWVFFFSFLPLYTISMAVLGFPRSRTSKISIYIVSIIRVYVHMSIYVHTYAHLVKELLCRIDSCCCGG